ncbi:gibberellic acid methyltransferase 2-like [Cryptomeria japonica]|uniref:gibberellic acid methyltransferase 2-like n=1 Tax=Cryptomeria japonica TaxID=3369 RepID=UPI0025AD7DAA|nr:gibberellic acid methyltransferase 2-like [Cryptomeria japonica]
MEFSTCTQAMQRTLQDRVMFFMFCSLCLRHSLKSSESPRRVLSELQILGATGLNTISDVNFVTRTLTNLCIGSELAVPQFQAFHSDLPSNDFDGLFRLLVRTNCPYFVAGVPGSFYNVLFPNSKIHVCFSIMALHWISEVPEAVVHKDSTFYNRRKVWVNRGRQDIADIYSKQSQKDLATFMKCRAVEIAPGGIFFLCLMGTPDNSPPTQ